MKRIMLAIVFFTCSLILAEQTKTLERSFPVKSSQKIILSDLSGAKLLIKSWNKNEAYVKLRVKISSSDKDFEKEYIKSVRLNESSNDDELRIDFDQTNEKGGGWSFLGIDLRINYYQKNEIQGEIYIPEKNNFQTNARYGDLWIENLKGEVELYGRSNKLTMKNCDRLKVVENDYGNTELQRCGGNLVLKNRSSNIEIRSFHGPLNIEAEYSNISVDEAGGKLVINSKSGNHKISNVKSDILVNSDYSEISIRNITGFADVTCRSGSIRIEKAEGINIEGDYSNITLNSITGNTKRIMKITGKSGNLEVTDLTGNLIIDNPYSGIKLQQIKGNIDFSGKSSTLNAYGITGNWKSNTEYMSIKIQDLSAKTIYITNKSNPVSLDLRSVPDDVHIENQYGEVIVDMPSGFSGEVDMNVTYGEINTNLPVKSKALGNSAYAAGKMGTGSGKFFIETKSGNIEVNEKGSPSAKN